MSENNKKTLLSEATVRRFAALANINTITPAQSRVVTEDSGREETDHEEANVEADEEHERDLERDIEYDKDRIDEQDAPEDELAAEEDELAAGDELALGDELGGLEDELGAEAELGAAEDDEDEARALAAELLADDSVVDAVGAALAALGDVTSGGSELEDVDDQEAMGELEVGEEIVDLPGEEVEEEEVVVDDEELSESLVNEIALRVAKRLLRRG